MNRQHDPEIIVFSCNFGWGYLGDKEILGSTIANWLPVSCCSKIDTELLLEAFAKGVAGVLILACPRSDCHFQDGGEQLFKRVELLRGLLAAHGIEAKRLDIVFGNDPQGTSIGCLVAEFARRLVNRDE